MAPPVRVLLLVTALAAAIVPVAHGAPVKVTPKATVASATKTATKVAFRIDVAFTKPKNAPCAGTVTATTNLTAKKRATFVGKLARVATKCVAKVPGKLPVAKFGQKVRFAITFKGTAKIKPFAFTAKLNLTPPPPPPPPAPPGPPSTPPPTPLPQVHQKGLWGTDIPTTGPDNRFKFRIISDDTIPTITPFGSGLTMMCGGSDTLTQTVLNYAHSFPVLLDVAKDNYHFVNGNTDLTYNVMFTFTSATAGTGHFDAIGAYDFGVAGIQSCHISQDFPIFWVSA